MIWHMDASTFVKNNIGWPCVVHEVCHQIRVPCIKTSVKKFMLQLGIKAIQFISAIVQCAETHHSDFSCPLMLSCCASKQDQGQVESLSHNTHV